MPITTRAPLGPFHAPIPQTTLLSPPWQHHSFLIKETSVDTSSRNCSRLGEKGQSRTKMNFGTNASLQEAALLLQEVASIASNELKGVGDFKLETQEIRKLPGMVELTSSDVSDSSESRYYVEDSNNNRFRTIRPNSSQSLSTPPGVLMAAPLGVSPMLPPFTLTTHIVHTVSPTPRSVLPSSQPPIILPLTKPTLQATPVLAHCNHEVPMPPTSSAIPAKKSKYVGASTPQKVKGMLKKKFSWKNYPDVSD